MINDIVWVLKLILFLGLLFLGNVFIWSKNAKADTLIVYETIIYESSGESEIGQMCVAKVIQNRMIERHLTAEQVCLQPKQFSCWNEKKHRLYSKKELVDAINAWSKAQKQMKDFRANLYHAEFVNPYWRTSPNVDFVIQIGKHLFYREYR